MTTELQISIGNLRFSLTFPGNAPTETLPYFIQSFEANFGPAENLSIVFDGPGPGDEKFSDLPRRFGLASGRYEREGSRWRFHTPFVFGPNRPDQFSVKLVSPALLFVLAELGVVPLHASAVVRGDKAFLFAGRSGCGKSTTAARIVAECRSSGVDAALLADDRVLIWKSRNSFRCTPSFEKPNPFNRWTRRRPEKAPLIKMPDAGIPFGRVASIQAVFFPELDSQGPSKIAALSSAAAFASLSVASSDSVASFDTLPNAYALTLGPVGDSLSSLVFGREILSLR